MKKDEIVTIELDDNNNSSNTLIIKDIVGEEAYLYHPLDPGCFLVKKLEELNKVAANPKDSTEQNLLYASKNKNYLDYNTNADLTALIYSFIFQRKLTPRQKSTLSNICGTIASIYFNNDIDLTMRYITDNKALLDTYNTMWVNNFKNLFDKSQQITSKKQRASIFNIAGFVLATGEPVRR